MKLYLTSLASGCIGKIDFAPKMTVAFIQTAADLYEKKEFVENDRRALHDKGLKLTEVDIKAFSQNRLYEKLANFDIMFFSGGNAHYLLEKMNQSGFREIVRKLLDKGVIYIGSSAGSVVVCPDINFIKPMDHQEKVPNLKDFTGLSLIGFYFLPHFGREKYAGICRQILQDNQDKEIIPVRDDELIVVTDDGWNVGKSY